MDTTKYFEIVDDGKTPTTKMMEHFKTKFGVYCYWDDLDKNFPAPKEKTIRYFLKQQEPDRLNVSYNTLKVEKAEFMTFREYLIAFEQYHDETRKYLDKVGWTIFSDEELPAGDVASGYWNPDASRSGFYWYNPDDCDPDLGARLAIPLPSELEPSSLESRIEALEKDMASIKKFLII